MSEKLNLKHIGKTVSPYGKIAAIGSIGGERYYWMVSHGGAVSMMPAIVVEQIWQAQGKNRRASGRKGKT